MDNLMTARRGAAQRFERRGKHTHQALSYCEGELSRPNLPATTIVARDLIRPNERKEKAENPSKGRASDSINANLISSSICIKRDWN